MHLPDHQLRNLQRFIAREDELAPEGGWLCARDLVTGTASVHVIARDLAALARAGMLDRGQARGRAWYRITARGAAEAARPPKFTQADVQRAIRQMATKSKK